MNGTKGDGPIKPIRPTPIRQRAVTPKSGARKLPEISRPRPMAPPPVRAKKSITPPRRNSDHIEIKNFFKAKPDSEPPSERMSIEIDVDADLGDNGPGTPKSNFPSVVVDFEDPVPELTGPPAETEKKLDGFVAIKRALFTVLKRIYPKADGKSLEFTEKKILLDSKEIGTVEKTVGGVSLRIWMHNLGLTVDSLPASTIFGLFNIADFFYADAKSKANYISLYAESVGKRSTIKICFHKEEKPGSFLSAPLFRISSAKKE